MSIKDVAIIGGGLSGLYGAYLLQQKGITNFTLLEARERFGGRISNFSSAYPSNQVDVGPTWFWPDLQQQLNHLILELGLEAFPQYETGMMVVEQSIERPPVLMNGYVSSPTSMRLKGGMNSLVQALGSKVNKESLCKSSNVTSIYVKDNLTHITYLDSDQDEEKVLIAKHILLALPPRLAIEKIKFMPELPSELVRQWSQTETWMAAQAKYVAIFDYPFWRERGLSGSARSGYGPMIEIHDASMPKEHLDNNEPDNDGQDNNGQTECAALFGFLGIPARQRLGISEDELKLHCRAQLKRLFGSEAATPKSDFIKDWAKEPYTATPLDLSSSGQHNPAPTNKPHSGPWQKKLTAICSEWSKQFPGYLAGAIEAAHEGVKNLTSILEEFD